MKKNIFIKRSASFIVILCFTCNIFTVGYARAEEWTKSKELNESRASISAYSASELVSRQNMVEQVVSLKNDFIKSPSYIINKNYPRIINKDIPSTPNVRIASDFVNGRFDVAGLFAGDIDKLREILPDKNKEKTPNGSIDKDLIGKCYSEPYLLIDDTDSNDPAVAKDDYSNWYGYSLPPELFKMLDYDRYDALGGDRYEISGWFNQLSPAEDYERRRRELIRQEEMIRLAYPLQFHDTRSIIDEMPWGVGFESISEVNNAFDKLLEARKMAEAAFALREAKRRRGAKDVTLIDEEKSEKEINVKKEKEAKIMAVIKEPLGDKKPEAALVQPYKKTENPIRNKGLDQASATDLVTLKNADMAISVKEGSLRSDPASRAAEVTPESDEAVKTEWHDNKESFIETFDRIAAEEPGAVYSAGNAVILLSSTAEGTGNNNIGKEGEGLE